MDEREKDSLTENEELQTEQEEEVAVEEREGEEGGEHHRHHHHHHSSHHHGEHHSEHRRGRRRHHSKHRGQRNRKKRKEETEVTKLRRLNAITVISALLVIVLLIVSFSTGLLQGPTGQRGATGASGYTPVKGEDYFTDEDKSELISGVVSELNGIPAYWTAHLEQQADFIRQTMETAGRNKSAFFWYTDAHWTNNSKRSPALLKWLYQNTPINKTNFGGDLVNDEPTLETLSNREIMKYIWEWRAEIRDLPNHHSVVGNHDDGGYTNNLFSEEYVYAYMLAPEESNDVVYGEEFYYYVDNAAEKTRYLYLDTAYKGFILWQYPETMYKQTAFVIDALSSVQEDWHVVVFAHRWFDYDYDNGKIATMSEVGQKYAVLFDAYNEREDGQITMTNTPLHYQFSTAKGYVEFCMGGHIHVDFDYTSPGGIPYIHTETDSFNIRSGLPHGLGTINESAVNAVIADYEAGEVRVIRIGRGNSRVVRLAKH